MKIDWSEAPEWAKFAAMDADGDRYWYAMQPKIAHPADDYWANIGRYAKAGHTPKPWQDSLEARP